MKRILIPMILIIVAIAISARVYSQCSCFGASIGGLTPVGGTTNIGVVRESNLRANMFYKYSYGDSYYKGDVKQAQGEIKSYLSQYMSFNAGYGITGSFTLEAEVGIFTQKTQDFRYWTESMSGLSHIMLSGKYNLFNSIKSEFEFTAGASIRAPFTAGDDSAFKFVNPSTGAWNFGLNLFVYKGYHELGLHFFMQNRTEFNTENKYGYIFGPANYTSFYTAYELFPFLTAIAEVRNELRIRDYMNEKYTGLNGTSVIKSHYAGDSGGDVVILSPQLNLNFKPVNISMFVELPVYASYNGSQLANSYSAGLNLAWNFNFSE